MRRYIFPLVLGLGGAAILVALALWQMQRLDWKRAVLAEIDAKLDAAPIPLASLGDPDPVNDLYLPVIVQGRTTGQELLVLSGRKGQGAGYEVIAAFERDDGGRILVDLGFILETMRDAERLATPLRIVGNLHWPDEADGFTPPPDEEAGLWFARDVAGMAAALGTDPILVVAREVTGDAQWAEPVPVDSATIPNNHLEYAITWFSLALVWLGMTGFLLWRIRQRET